ncbi:MAG: TIGR00269 family protein [Methanoregulaceae archaeon]|nr:TIGR00269 family protein [Methanoregulaceae archaeon]
MVEADRCSFCQEPAVIRGREQAERWCASHLAVHLEDRVREHIRENSLVSPGDHIAVALSGGKDSTALLLILTLLIPEWKEVSITAITVDEGIAEYRDETIESAVSITRHLGIRHHIISFPDLFGADLDTLIRRSGSGERACTICGVLRRKALAEAARMIGATKIATGHNLDDEAQSVLMNVLRGDLVRLVQDSSSGEPDCFIPRIKPLARITEKEVVAYLFVRDSYSELPECPYAGSALRSEIRSMLGRLEYRHPGTREALLRSQAAIRKQGGPPASSEGVRRCGRCGTLCNSEICQACRILESLGP